MRYGNPGDPGLTRGGPRLWLALGLAPLAMLAQVPPPEVLWVSPPAASYVQGVDGDVHLAWEIRNSGYDPAILGWNAFTNPQRWDGTQFYNSGEGQSAQAVAVANGAFATTVPVSGPSRTWVCWPTPMRYRIRYVHNSLGPFYSAEAQTTFYPHGPVFVSITPQTITVGANQVVQIVGHWVVPDSYVPAGSPPLTVTVGGVPITNPIGWFFDGSTNPPSCALTFVASPTGDTAAPGPRDVAITNPDGQSVTQPNAITFVAAPVAPTVISVTPNHGPTRGGTLVTVAGTGFQPGARVQFGGEYATDVTFVDSTALTCRTPAFWAADVWVSVYNPPPDGLSGHLQPPNGFTFRDSVRVTAVTPSSGVQGGGTRVTIAGEGFSTSGGLIVVFGDDPACQGTEVNVTSPGVLTCLTPPHLPEAVDVAVFNPDHEAGLLPAGYTYAPARVTAKFTEKYTRTMVPATSTSPAHVVHKGQFKLKGTLELTGFDIAKLNQHSAFLFGPVIGPGVSEALVPCRLGDDDDYAAGDTKATITIRDAAAGVTVLVAKLSWDADGLRFQVTGTYGRNTDVSTGTSTESGYWLLAQELLDGPAESVGLWAFGPTLTAGTAIQTGYGLVAYVSATKTKKAKTSVSVIGVLTD